ncbi:hypothetical protein B5F40_10620 [Gordonibacter sp. An230]|uniref:tyrosine-type recombinase/integrase n=1 Tax=Gordonibacter sp. An230 TaxID=1965592 RepID=UPI000B3A94BE|nr:site-specific integrase [Gordonibacter sp. An230]OUO89551.1 hypothetical protein B5F40_10620 [Gordonibacter sp. An230]
MARQRITIQGEGSITEVERGHVYRIRLRLPPEKPGGKLRWSPQRTVHGNKAKARQAVEQYRVELEAELNGETLGLTVGQYAREFHERRKTIGALSPLTLERDELEISRIEQLFGKVLVEELTTADVNNAYAKLRKQGLSSSALHKLHAKLRQIMKQAVREGVIPHNPCDMIEGVKRPAARERRSLSAEQAMQLARDLKEAPRNGRIVAVWLALATGIRRGEALGLVWANVDLDNGRIRIDKQLDSKGNRHDPKSKTSKRNLSIDEGTVAFLKEWRTMQASIFNGGAGVPSAMPVCTNEHGDFIEPNVFNRWRRQWFADHGLGGFKVVEEYADKHGVKRYRAFGYEGFNFHELRHTQATLLIGGGADIKTVQNRLGHSSASLTMDIYAHAIEQNDREAATIIGSMLG